MSNQLFTTSCERGIKEHRRVDLANAQ